MSECEEPSPIHHGKSNFGETTFGSIVSYVCDGGYVLNGQSSIKCDVENEKPIWNSEAPVCEEKSMFTRFAKLLKVGGIFKKDYKTDC